MRKFVLAACAAMLVPSAALAAGSQSACDAAIERIRTSAPNAEDTMKPADGRGLSEAQLAAATATLDAAKQLEPDDIVGCLTLANAARSLLVRGAMHPEPAPIVALESWDQTPLTESTWRAEALIGADAYSYAGESVGHVQDILLSDDGAISAVVVEGGGVLDIGDRHVRVGWDQVRLHDADDGGVAVPLKADQMSDYSFFDSDRNGVKVGRDETRVSHVLGKEVRYKNGAPYGYVDDLLFTNGKAKATLIRPDVAYGLRSGMRPFATPYYVAEYGYGAGYDFYLLPYDEAEVDGLTPFDADSVGGPNPRSEPGMGS